jgi:hypothetical protein
MSRCGARRHADAVGLPLARGEDPDGVADAGPTGAGPGESARAGGAVVLGGGEPDGGGTAAGDLAAERRALVPALSGSGAHGAAGPPPPGAPTTFGCRRSTAVAVAVGRERPGRHDRAGRLDGPAVGGTAGCARLVGERQDRAALGRPLGCPLAARPAGGQGGPRASGGPGAAGQRVAGRLSGGAEAWATPGRGLRGRGRPGPVAARWL